MKKEHGSYGTRNKACIGLHVISVSNSYFRHKTTFSFARTIQLKLSYLRYYNEKVSY